MDSFLESVTAIVEEETPPAEGTEVEKKEEQELNEQQRLLVELEMWGKQKRWNEIEFVHRMRNMRSQNVFDMQRTRLEKCMER